MPLEMNVILNQNLRSNLSRISEEIEIKSFRSKTCEGHYGRTHFAKQKTPSEKDLFYAVINRDSSEVKKLVKSWNGTFRALGSWVLCGAVKTKYR